MTNRANSHNISKLPCKFSVFHQNISSLRENFDDFLIDLNNTTVLPDVIILTEIWIHSCELDMYNIVGYNQYAKCNDSYRSGGVVVYVSERYAAKQSAVDIQSADALIVTVQLDLDQSLSLTLLALYRLHSQTVASFLNDLNVLLADCSDRNLLVVGDMNLCLLKQSHQVDNYLTIMASNGLDQLIDSPTRGKSCLDHLFLRTRDNFEFRAMVCESCRSDHDAVVCELFNFKSNIENNCIGSNDSFKEIDYNKLFDLLQETDWSSVYREQDVDVGFNVFIQTLNHFINLSTFSRNRNSKVKFLKPWMTVDLCQRQKFRKTLYSRSKKRPNDKKFQRFFNNFSKKLKKDIGERKSSYYYSLFEKNKNDMKKQWKTINNVLGVDRKRNEISGVYSMSNSNVLVSEECDIAVEFNHFFVNVVNDLIRKTESISVDPRRYNDLFPSPIVGKTFFCYPTCSEEVLSCINKLTGNKSPGIDGISANVVKKVANIISPVISHLINLSFETGCFPESLKVALVIPLHKKDNNLDLNNYRPISLLSVFSKIFEKIMKLRILKFLNSNNFFCKNQFGFMEGKSTEDALLNFCSFVFEGLNQNEFVGGIFVDITKAFDSVNHELLCDTLWRAGVRGTPLNWFKSYLSNRQQCVRVRRSVSDSLSITHGVPQGSVLGPILFLVYINSLCNGKFSGSLSCFADDTAICYRANSQQDLVFRMQSDLDKLKIWFTRNKMVLSTKTKSIQFSLKKCHENLNLFYKCKHCLLSTDVSCNNCIKIEQVDHIKYLGIVLDERLNWKNHVAQIKRYMYAVLRKFYFLKFICPLPVLRTVYYSIVNSKLQYGLSCWGGTYYSTLYPLMICQNKIIRIMCGAKKRDSAYPLYVTLNILPLRYLYIYRVLRIFFLRGGHLRGNLNVYSERLQNLNRVKVPFPRFEAYKRFFTYAAPKLFNCLPISVSSSRTSCSFVKNLRAWLISNNDVEMFIG
jgi:hypothetical protein